jgi:hypothetical protein
MLNWLDYPSGRLDILIVHRMNCRKLSDIDFFDISKAKERSQNRARIGMESVQGLGYIMFKPELFIL